MGIACKYKKNEEGGEEGKNCYLNFKTKEIFYIGACPWFNFCGKSLSSILGFSTLFVRYM